MARVDVAEFARIRRQRLREGRRYSSGDLDGAIIDCDYGLDAAGFVHRRVTKTGEAERMVVYRFAPPSGAANEDVAALLEASWLRDGAFVHEAHTLSLDNGPIVLDFVTWWDNGAFYTGRIEVAGQS